MAFFQDYGAAQKSVTSALVDATRSASQVANEDPEFLRTSSRAIDKSLDQKSARLLTLTEKLVRRSAFSESSRVTKLNNVNSVESKWKHLVDAADSLLERADIALDEFKGYIRMRDSPKPEKILSSRQGRPARLFRDADVPKPQLQFADKLSNFESEPFKPLLTEKPNAQIPLRDSLQKQTKDGSSQWSHPYEAEIQAFNVPARLDKLIEPQQYLPFDDTKATWVENEDQLQEMLGALRQAKEIAVDLEHHDMHSYIGLVSLMQISTRDRDWVIDTLKPWRRKLEILNEVFTDPNIIKVFHGSSSDIIWLQRDFGIYVVGLFDTYHASRLLGYARHGLAFLLDKFVHFEAQKQYQTADWRVRPLPQELFDYARSDTHFLLYVFDCIRNELLQKSGGQDDLLLEVFEQSKSEALQQFEYPFYVDDVRPAPCGWFTQLKKAPRLESDYQLAVFIAVHKWRDQLAREEDESPHTIMPIWVFHNIITAMPSDKPALFRCISNMSQFVRPRLDELLELIQTHKLNPQRSLADVNNAFSEWRASVSHKIMQAPVTSASTVVSSASNPMTDVGNVKADESSFWGPSMKGDTNHSLPTSTDMIVPRIFSWNHVSPSDAKASYKTIPTGADMTTLTKPTLTNKRKAEDDLSEPDTGGAENRSLTAHDSDSPDDVDAHLKKIQKKAERRAAKRDQKKANEGDAQLQASDTAPFDYTQAPSLLHVQGGKHGTNTSKMAPSPYSKASETQESLRRSMPKPGKSSTYR